MSVFLISNRDGAPGGFNSVVLNAALEDGALRAAQYVAAHRVAGFAKAQALEHFHTGHLASSIEVRERNRADLEVVATDKDSWHIEFGHDAPDGSWVQGLHIMRNSAIFAGGIGVPNGHGITGSPRVVRRPNRGVGRRKALKRFHRHLLKHQQRQEREGR